jgi:hypothetical protein
VSYTPASLTEHQKWFLYSAGFAEFAVLMYVLYKLIEGHSGAFTYISYAASICLFLHAILRYLVTAAVYHTEETLTAIGVTWLMVFVGAATIFSCLSGPLWFVFVALLCGLGIFKATQAKHRVRDHATMSQSEKAFHIHIQDGLFTIQLMLMVAMLAWGITAGTKVGDYVGVRGFGVCNLPVWHNGFSVSGALFCLIVMAYVTVRIFVWYRGDVELIFRIPTS